VTIPLQTWLAHQQAAKSQEDQLGALGRRPLPLEGQWTVRPDVPGPQDCPPRHYRHMAEESIASRLEASAEAIVDQANRETSLGVPRLKNEMARTCNQMRMFATVVEEGSWVQARIDPALPDRQPGLCGLAGLHALRSLSGRPH